MNRSTRALAMLLAALLAVVMLFSVFYIALEADHDCHGEDCAVCAVLSACERVLHRLLGIGAAAVFMLAAAAVVYRAADGRGTASAHSTLITLKVKLSD